MRVGRISLAASADGKAIYAGFESTVRTAGGATGSIFKLFRSADGGATWTSLPKPPNDGQLGFNNTLAVSPHQARTVYVGQIALWRAVDGGDSGSWTNLSCCRGDGNGQRTGIDLHADLHEIAFAAPGSFAEASSVAEVVYVANDGGVARGTINDVGAVHWEAASRGLAIGQCGTIDISGSTSESAVCGVWHNGNARTADGGANWIQVGGGDGFQATLDAGNAMTTFFNCNAFSGGSICRGQVDPLHVIPITGEATIWGDDSTLAHWSDPFHPGHLLRVQKGLLYLATGADTKPASELLEAAAWEPVEPPGKTGATTTVAFARAPIDGSPRYYLGTDTGEIWFGSPASGWQKICGCGEPVRGLATGRADGPFEVFAVLGADGTRGRVRRAILTTHSGWVNLAIDDAFTPEVPVVLRNLAVDPFGPAAVYVGTDQGIYRGEEQPAGDWVWERSPGMPHVVVTDLVTHLGPGGPSGVVRAGTWGRGVFEVFLFLHAADAPVALNVRASEQVDAGAERELAVRVALTTPVQRLERETPFDLALPVDSAVILEAPAEVQVGGDRLTFSQWMSPGGRTETQRRLELNLEETTAVVAQYRPTSLLPALAVIAVVAGEDGAPRDPGARIEILEPAGLGDPPTPFEIALTNAGTRVRLRAPAEVTDSEGTLVFAGWNLPDGSAATSLEVLITVTSRESVTAYYKRSSLPRIGEGHLATFVGATAQPLDATGLRHEVRVSWVVAGGEPPIAVEVTLKTPTGALKEVSGLPLVGELRFEVPGEDGERVKVTLAAVDATGSRSRARAYATLCALVP